MSGFLLLTGFLGLLAGAKPILQTRLSSAFGQTITSIAQTQGLQLSPYRDSSLRKLVFRPNTSDTENAARTFKVTVFSDLHFGENPWDDWGPEQDRNSTILMRKVLSEEDMDFVVLNGDQITGENTFRENSTTLIDEILAPIKEVNVPFASTQGNHDNQGNITHLEEIQREHVVAPNLSYTRVAPLGVGGEGGEGNYWLPIYATDEDTVPALIFWFFDSRGGVHPVPNSNTNLPDWVDESVVQWAERETAWMDSTWQGADWGTLAFVHIPPSIAEQIQETLDNTTNPGLNDDLLKGTGSVQATYEEGNQGKDAPFWDVVSTKLKNLYAVISGHDHGDEWCAPDANRGIMFCFDKHSGYGGYDNPTWGHGVRNLVFTLNTTDTGYGKTMRVETWIRLEEGEVRDRISLN